MNLWDCFLSCHSFVPDGWPSNHHLSVLEKKKKTKLGSSLSLVFPSIIPWYQGCYQQVTSDQQAWALPGIWLCRMRQRAATTAAFIDSPWQMVQRVKRPVEIPSKMFVLLSKDKEKVNSVTPESLDIFHCCLCDRECEFMKNAAFTERRRDDYAHTSFNILTVVEQWCWTTLVWIFVFTDDSHIRSIEL